MSVKCMARVWEHSQLKGGGLLLMLAIADHASDDGFAWPGEKRLAFKTRMSERQVRRLITEAETKRELYVHRDRQRRRNNQYLVLLGQTDAQKEKALSTRFSIAAEDKTVPIPDKMSGDAGEVSPDKMSGTPDIAVSGTQDIAMSSYPSTKPSTEPVSKESPPGPAPKFSLLDLPVPTHWLEWANLIKDGKPNRPAVLHYMFEVLYPDRECPSFAFLAKVARLVGGARRLGSLLWQHSSNPPSGDLLPYIIAAYKRGDRSNGTYSRGSRGDGQARQVEEYTPELAERVNAEIIRQHPELA